MHLCYSVHCTLSKINIKDKNLCFEVGVKVNSKVCYQQSLQQVGSVHVAEPSPTTSDCPAPLVEVYLCCDNQGQPQEIRGNK